RGHVEGQVRVPHGGVAGADGHPGRVHGLVEMARASPAAGARGGMDGPARAGLGVGIVHDRHRRAPPLLPRDLMIKGFATPEGTAAYQRRMTAAPSHFREFQGLTLSTLGLGTYLGAEDEATDRAYASSVTPPPHLRIHP